MIMDISESVESALRFTDVHGNHLKHEDRKIDPDRAFLVLMVGPRRCGKTSVLTSIQKCIKSTVASSRVFFEPRCAVISDGNTKPNKFLDFFLKSYFGVSTNTKTNSVKIDGSAYEEKVQQLIEFADNPYNDQNESGAMGIAATHTIVFHDFVMYHDEDPGNIYLVRFIDVPGEFFIDKGNDIAKLIQRSNMIIIAIDTPALMSKEQPIIEACNKVNVINNYFNKPLDENNQWGRLVLFAPLKCEYSYWYDEDYANGKSTKMKEINTEIKKQYKQMIDRLSANTTIAITPVLTIGGVTFSYFDPDENGKIIRDPSSNLPYANYVKVAKASRHGYNPLYCDQPFFYLLAFMSNMQNRVTINDGLKDKLIDKFSFIKSVHKIQQDKKLKLSLAIRDLSKSIITNQKGFEIISDPKQYL